MATSCTIEYTSEELKTIGYYSISIPYEINHNFFLEAHLMSKKWKILWVDEVISFPDYGSWVSYQWDEIDVLLNRLDSLEKNIDNITKDIPIPKMIGMSDWRAIVWYEYHRRYDWILDQWIDSSPYSTYVEILAGSYVNCEKKDILYIIFLIKNLAQKAKEINKSLRFIWE